MGEGQRELEGFAGSMMLQTKVPGRYPMSGRFFLQCFLFFSFGDSLLIDALSDQEIFLEAFGRARAQRLRLG